MRVVTQTQAENIKLTIKKINGDTVFGEAMPMSAEHNQAGLIGCWIDENTAVIIPSHQIEEVEMEFNA